MALVRSPIATFRRVVDGLLVALILVVLFGVVLGRVVPVSGWQTFVIGGGSMEPAIPLGAAVVTEPVPATHLAVGDVVTLRTGPQLQSIFTHRITRIVTRDDGPWIETKGDNNEAIDPSITPARQVIGRVTATIPYAGYLLALLSIPSGVLVVLLVAGFLLALTWLLESFEVERPRKVPVAVPAAQSSPIDPATVAIDPSRAAELRAARMRRTQRTAPVRGRGSMAVRRSRVSIRAVAGGASD